MDRLMKPTTALITAMAAGMGKSCRFLAENASERETMNFSWHNDFGGQRNGRIAVARDSQVTQDNTVVKHRAKKVRRIYNNKIIVGFAGTTADAESLGKT